MAPSVTALSEEPTGGGRCREQWCKREQMVEICGSCADTVLAEHRQTSGEAKGSQSNRAAAIIYILWFGVSYEQVET